MAADPTLSWIVALAVVTVVLSCCVLFTLRQIYNLGEKVKKSSAAAESLQSLQDSLRVLTEAQQEQAKKLREKELQDEREAKEKAENKEQQGSEHMLNRIETLEKGLLDHEMKVEDAVSRAVLADSFGGSGGKKGAGLGGDGSDLDGKGALSMSVGDFAVLMQATKQLDPAMLAMSPSSTSFSATTPSAAATSDSYSSPNNNARRIAQQQLGMQHTHYTPSPAFSKLLEHGSLRNNQNVSPSNGLFASSSSSSPQKATNQLLLGGSKKESGTPQLPPMFWVYERSHGGGSSSSSSSSSGGGGGGGALTIRSLRRRQHAISYISGERTSLVLKFTVPEAVSALSSTSSSSSSSSSSSLAGATSAAGGAGAGGSASEKQQQQQQDQGLPADGAGPGVIAIPIASITLIEVELASRDVIESFASITAGNSPPVVCVVRIEHRGLLGEWSPARQTLQNQQSFNRDVPTASSPSSPSSSSSSSSSSGVWTRMRTLEKASKVSSLSARGTATTAFFFFVPISSPSAVQNLQRYLDFLHKIFPSQLLLADPVLSFLRTGGGGAGAGSGSPILNNNYSGGGAGEIGHSEYLLL